MWVIFHQLSGWCGQMFSLNTWNQHLNVLTLSFFDVKILFQSDHNLLGVRGFQKHCSSIKKKQRKKTTLEQKKKQ